MTPEHAQARCGKATSSEFKSVLAKGEGKTRAKYLRQVLAERLTGLPTETQATGSWAKNLERGNEQEPYARMAYEAWAGVMVEESEFYTHASLEAGCSPDGKAGPRRGVEIKSVIPTVQIETILRGGYPAEHVAQIQGGLWITGWEDWDFVSYCPEMPEHLRLYTFRVQRDERYIATLAIEVRGFLEEVETLYQKLMKGE